MRTGLIALLVVGWLLVGGAVGGATPCAGRWVEPGTRLRDHTFFEFEGAYYFVATRIHEGAWEEHFAYARTRDFCQWDSLGTILAPGPAGAADEARLWAPHVIREGNRYYLYYTGVNRHFAQQIMLATSTNPADPQSWVKRGVRFQPDHPGMIYPAPAAWADARDPMILAHAGRYYLYYTGLDESGGIVGVAMAAQVEGPWQDLGATLRLPPASLPESPFVVSQDDTFYLFYNRTGAGGGPEWRWAPSPFGPWQAPNRETMGWAHDFARIDGRWYASFIEGASEAIAVRPLRWEQQVQPPAPRLGHRLFLPHLSSTTQR